jgi:predicted alpha/beta-fold hydrolase
MLKRQTSLQTPARRSTARLQKPQVYCADNAKNRQIIHSLRQLHHIYRPTPWLFNTHLQLMFLSARKKNAGQSYDRIEPITMQDGGQTALAWIGDALPARAPTIVVLHTLTGSPQSMQELMIDLHRHTGWRVVLCIRRAHAGLPLTSPAFNIFGSVTDLSEQLELIRARLPDSALYGVGSSAGSGLLVRYLGLSGDASLLRAAFAYSPGYNTDTGFDNIHRFYSRYMAKKLINQFVLPHHSQIAHLPTGSALPQSHDLTEFNRHAYEFAGYGSFDEYAKDINPMRVFTGVRVPIMVLNAEDDPICNIANVSPYLDTMRQMPNTILVTTRQGSHCAHYEGWRATSWAARLMAQYLLTIHDMSTP